MEPYIRNHPFHPMEAFAEIYANPIVIDLSDDEGADEVRITQRGTGYAGSTISQRARKMRKARNKAARRSRRRNCR